MHCIKDARATTQMWRRQIILALLLGLPALARAFTVNYTNTTGDDYALNPNVTAVVFDDSVTAIADSAFMSCTKLGGHIDLSNTNVTVIGRDAFGSTKITSVSFPTSLQIIDNAAFYNCKNLNGHIDLKNVTVTFVFERSMWPPNLVQDINAESAIACDTVIKYDGCDIRVQRIIISRCVCIIDGKRAGERRQPEQKGEYYLTTPHLCSCARILYTMHSTYFDDYCFIYK